MSINSIISHLRETIQKPIIRDDVVDVRAILYDLLIKENWSLEDFTTLHLIEEKLDINKYLNCYYSPKWRRESSEILAEPWYSILSLLIYKKLVSDRMRLTNSGRLYKRANVLLKSLEKSTAKWLFGDGTIGQIILLEIKSIIKLETGQRDINNFAEQADFNKNGPFRTIPLTILYYEGPIARAYLQTLYSLRLKPTKIIHLVPNFDLSTGKPIGRYLPPVMRRYLAYYLQKFRIHFWSKHISKVFPELQNALIKNVSEKLNFSEATIFDANTDISLKRYSDDITQLLVNGLNDVILLNYLSVYPPSAILYTGGGIMPSALLNLEQLRFIHIHPGFLPELRGADCILWSNLLKGSPSVSCFYMSKGIDTGNIIFSKWLPALPLNFSAGLYETKTMYRAIYAFIDPWIRSSGLRHLVSINEDFSDLKSNPQSENDGITYHFMHPEIQKILFENYN